MSPFIILYIIIFLPLSQNCGIQDYTILPSHPLKSGQLQAWQSCCLIDNLHMMKIQWKQLNTEDL